MLFNKLIVTLSSHRVGCHVDGVCFNNKSVCDGYFRDYGLKYNAQKSEVMVFKAGTKCPADVPPVKLVGMTLKRVHRFKYLDYVVTDDLKNDEDIERER